MKKFYVSLFASLFTGLVFAQSYIPLPEAGGKWVNTYSSLQQSGGFFYLEPQSSVSYCTPGIDTLINEQSYFQVDTCNGGYKGALRNETGKVYFVPKDHTNEYLLYDFTVNAGDTLFNLYYELYWGDNNLEWIESEYQVVSAVDSIIVDGTYRKRIELMGAMWIEGVGNSFGLFLEPWINISEYGVNLHCFSVDENTVYPEFAEGACNFTVGLKELSKSINFSIYPNPGDGMLYLSTKDSNYSIDKSVRVFNAQGQLLFAGVSQSSGQFLSVDLRSFPSGIYFISAEVNGRLQSLKYLKL